MHHNGAHESCACPGCLLLASHPQTRTSLAHHCQQAGGLHGAMDGGSVQGPRHAAEPDAGRVRAGRYHRGSRRAQGACARKCAPAAKLQFQSSRLVQPRFLRRKVIYASTSRPNFLACAFAALDLVPILSLGCPKSCSLAELLVQHVREPLKSTRAIMLVTYTAKERASLT